jgi:hypothetical protein
MTIVKIAAMLVPMVWAMGASAQTSSNPELICAQSTTVFCDGFETGNFSIWDDYDGNPAPWNSLINNPGPLSRPNNTVTRLRVPAGRGGTDLVKVLGSASKKLYARWYQQWETGYDFSAPNHGSGLHAGGRDYLGRSDYRPLGNDWFTAWLEPYSGRLNLYAYYRGMYQDCSNPNGACWGDHFPCMVDSGATYCTKPQHRPNTMPPELVTGRWYCLEMMVDGGAPSSTGSGANGELDFWIDGVQYGPWTNLWMRTSSAVNIEILWLDLFHHADHSAEGVLIDDVVVSATPIGCLNNPAIRPRPPTDVTVL